MAEKTVEIAIIDDHEMFADGLSHLLADMDDTYRCTVFNSPLDAIEVLADGGLFDLIISDLIMENLNGIAFVKALRSRGFKMPVLIVSGVHTAPPVEEALRLGAQGFIPKTATQAMLSDALDTVFAGETYLPPQLWDLFEQDRYAMRGGNAVQPDSQLSERQIEVLNLIADGHSNREVAYALNISENTVKSHLKHIFKVLNVGTRAACIRRAQQTGLIS
ncbi:response regulator transcription factor [Hoeflea sp. WL0058]|uniref:Response regulator transcription factor n=1 Tax=Flavimaribacter sediminis TaxID=2865987 RepID=A0AAE2ZPC9_9HYPH|nr:response regulator transcription factor [Flavimaribacter sediminis]MBW8639791.1 response regulator transcription factor [Flavimaribacter sediminis]